MQRTFLLLLPRMLALTACASPAREPGQAPQDLDGAHSAPPMCGADVRDHTLGVVACPATQRVFHRDRPDRYSFRLRCGSQGVTAL